MGWNMCVWKESWFVYFSFVTCFISRKGIIIFNFYQRIFEGLFFTFLFLLFFKNVFNIEIKYSSSLDVGFVLKSNL